MTWGEFKRAVEEKGVTDETTVNVIDIYGSYGEEFTVRREEDGSVSVW